MCKGEIAPKTLQAIEIKSLNGATGGNSTSCGSCILFLGFTPATRPAGPSWTIASERLGSVRFRLSAWRDDRHMRVWWQRGRHSLTVHGLFYQDLMASRYIRRKTQAVSSHDPLIACSHAAPYPPSGRDLSFTKGARPYRTDLNSDCPVPRTLKTENTQGRHRCLTKRLEPQVF